MTTGYYILRGREVVPATFEEYVAQMRVPGSGRVALTEIGGGVKVSTIFLGEKASREFGGTFTFETQILGGPLDEQGQRSRSYDEAEEAHARWVEQARAPVTRPCAAW